MAIFTNLSQKLRLYGDKKYYLCITKSAKVFQTNKKKLEIIKDDLKNEIGI